MHLISNKNHLSRFVCLVLLTILSKRISCCDHQENEYVSKIGSEGLDSETTLTLLSSLRRRLYNAKMMLWSRGVNTFRQEEDMIRDVNIASLQEHVESLEKDASWNLYRLGPVRQMRHDFIERGFDTFSHDYEFDDIISQSLFDNNRNNWGTKNIIQSLRGGELSTPLSVSDYDSRLKAKLNELGMKFGPDFIEAIKLNEIEHIQDCNTSCESFYCAPSSINHDDITTHTEDFYDTLRNNGTTFTSYNFGATPPEDFAEQFGFPLDIIKVSKGAPLFSSEESVEVISIAQQEGIEQNEYQSGKYKLGGDWLVNLPRTREWFNRRLESTFFPLLSTLFPEIISSPAVLRAHSVSLLKYNITHPRTDVHIDNGILAMTLAMSPKDEYDGGGTFFEHMDHVIHMDVGHGTFRPGSVRHGGHKVTRGTRYILGAFLLLTDRTEHVRRLKNRGSDLRKNGDLERAAKHFEWALAINPKCTTCLKDWAEILFTQKNFKEAESKIRQVLELLEERDSDALFTLGLILSEQGRDDESIEAYSKSIILNADDAELCYNLGIKLGARGDTKGEMKMYAKATIVDPKFGGAWLNWGTSLAETGNLEDAEVMFLKAMECPEVKAKAMMNLALVFQKRANILASGGDLDNAKLIIQDAANYLDEAKVLLDKSAIDGKGGSDEEEYLAKFAPLRIQCHRLLGSIFAGMKNYEDCEKEFRIASQNFPTVPGVWEMLARVLELQGKVDEAGIARERLKSL